MHGLMHTYFLGLTAVGFDALWGTMMRNGTGQAIGAAKLSGVLPDGSTLRRIYTAVPSLGKFLLSPVIFYVGLTHDRNPVYRSLLVSLFSTMQTLAFCTIANGGRSSWSVLESMFWGVFNQSHGGAFVYPMYFLTHLNQASDDKDDSTPVPVEDAEALLYTSIFASALPAWLLYPAFFPCSTETRQLLIATYRVTPVLLSLARPAIAAAIRRFRTKPLPESRSRLLVKASLVLSGACAALGHLYAVASSIVYPGVTLSSVFWPWATLVDRLTSAVIGQGCHVFLQYDWLVFIAAIVPYVSLMLSSSRHSSELGDGDSWYGWAENKFRALGGRLVTLTAMTVVFSPGAVLAWGMATRV